MSYGAGSTALDVMRQSVVRIDNFKLGAVAPIKVTIGTTPVIAALRFANIDETISAYEILPLNYSGGTMSIILIWSLVSTQTNNDTLNVTLDYVAPIIYSTGDGAARDSTQLTATTTVTTAKGLAIGDIYTMEFILNPLDTTNPLASANGIGWEFHLTNTSGVASADLLSACLNYEVVL